MSSELTLAEFFKLATGSENYAQEIVDVLDNTPPEQKKIITIKNKI